MLKPIDCGDRTLRFYERGLGADAASVAEIAVDVVRRTAAAYPYALERCTFFADRGYDVLAAALGGRDGFGDPRIEGNDRNPSDQHYWLAFDCKTGPVVLDPIFDYVGLQMHASDVLGDGLAAYYARKRRVPPHTPQWEGGVQWSAGFLARETTRETAK